ncbi:SusF/SusE family outer membrane protein [Bacteroides sp. 519]|uniref:SusF/SusE family outer membrane protein n=1 Tax=Bacteroides sp. 519 TaxID=2302937 RepID=UPI0013CFCA26|nr:SusF/SusE family outer membrane protein [Bacteroides sp. 519]NDV56974.1 DUF5115 domain-containing protein [Bacteroides sp. 519]
MKNISIYIMMLLALCVTACDEDFNKDVAAPQTNPQENPQTIAGFSIAKDTDFNSAIVLADLEEGTMLTAVKATATPEMAEGASVAFRLQLSDTEDFANIMDLASISEGNAATVLVEDLNATVIELFGKAPEARTTYLRAYIYILDGTSASMMPDPIALGTVIATPISPEIDSAYYLIGTPNGWNGEDVSTLLKFSHSGKDVYEDSEFTLMFEATEDSYWKIIPQKLVDAVNNGEAADVWKDGVLGTAVNDDDSLEGELVDTDPGAGLIKGTGWIKMTLNMMERTYKVEIIGEMARTLYVPGSYQDWKPATAATLYTQNVDFKYDGYANLNANAEFKFVNGPDWPNGDNGYKDYGTDLDGDTGNLNGSSNISTTEAGFYRLTVDLSGSVYTYTATKTVWGLIGDATTGGWDNSTEMTLDPETYKWTVTTTLAAGTFKFRANNGWDINLGGDLNNLTYGGDNISIDADGEYIITLDLSDPKAYKATVVKK